MTYLYCTNLMYYLRNVVCFTAGFLENLHRYSRTIFLVSDYKIRNYINVNN